MNSPKAQTELLFDAIAQFVAESREMLATGKVLELAGLDEYVGVMCEAVLQLSQDERLRYADRLQQLLGDLKSLGDDMVAQRDALAEEMRGLAQHKKASVAYRVVDASDDFGDRGEESE